MRPIDADALKEELGIAEDCDDCERLGEHGCVNSTWAIVCDRIESAPTIDAAPRWILCGERLPEEYGLYLATMNDGFVQECSYVPTDYGDVLLNGWSTCEAAGFKILNLTDVLAWMPLPEPYKGERRDDDTD